MLLCLAAIEGFAQVTVDASIDSTQLFIGQQAKIKLQVSMNAGQNLLMPQFPDTIVAGVEVVDVAKPDTHLPPFEVSVDNKLYRSKNPLALKVYSVPVDTLHLDQFFGPKPIQEVSITWGDIDTLVYSLLIMLILAGVSVFFVIRYRDNKPIIKIIKIEPKLPPHQMAMKKIDEIKSDKAKLRNDPKAYYTELTDVIRTYIKDRFNFNALEMTSTEIIEHLMQVKDQQSIAELKSLFETADLVKFAKHAPLMNENDMNLVNAVDFINETKEEEDPNAKKEPTEIRVEEKRSKQGRIILICSIALTSVGAVVALYFAIRRIIELFF